MKKFNHTKKLTLRTETVKTLQVGALKQVAGGGEHTSFPVCPARTQVHCDTN